MKNRTIVYCRESRDDYGKDYERIEVQRDLLLRYCKEHELDVIDIIMDDDQTGTSFSRYDEIKKRALRNEFDIILFKNSARLGRNQKESLMFVDFLEECGIEIRFENEHYDEEIFGLMAWFNERRARDDSKNIRRNLREKMEQGKLIVRPIYGYIVVNKQLVKDENMAHVVKVVFDLFTEQDMGYRKIADYLNKKGYKTPSEERNHKNAPRRSVWHVQHIKRIIQDIRYTGCYVGGSTEKLSFKSKKTIRKPKEDWIIIPNMHEAIISMEQYEKAQIIRERREKVRKKIKEVDKGYNLFSGILRCGRCGGAMYYRKSPKKQPVYLCKRYWIEGAVKDDIREGYGCTSHNIQASYLDEIVKGFINSIIDNTEFKKYVVENVRCVTTDRERIQKRIHKLKEQKNSFNLKISQIYDDKLNGVIPESLFKTKYAEFEDKIKVIDSDILQLNNEICELDRYNNKEELVMETLQSLKENGLGKDDIKKLFKKITIFSTGDIKEEDKVEYGLTDQVYKEILEKGGVAVQLNFLYQFGMSSRRM